MSRATCARCGQPHVYRSDFAPLQAGGSPIVLYRAGANDVAIEVQLCAACGHVELAIAERHRKHLAAIVAGEHWHPVTDGERG